MNTARPQHEANLREQFAASLMHLYPLKSGCGTIVNSKLFATLAGTRNVDLWAQVEGGVALVPSLDLVGRSMFFAGDLDPKVSWVVDRYVNAGDVALDIGANLGLVTLRLAKRVGPSGSVHAFEPNPAILRYLEATLQRNSTAPVTLHRTALGATASALSLIVPKANAGAASFISVGRREVDRHIEVLVARLDDFIDESKISHVDFIKMDVEGFEAEVLKGAGNTLSKIRPRVILLEENSGIDGPELPEALKILLDQGYSLFGLPKRLTSVEMLPLDRVRNTGAHDFVALLDKI